MANLTSAQVFTKLTKWINACIKQAKMQNEDNSLSSTDKLYNLGFIAQMNMAKDLTILGYCESPSQLAKELFAYHLLLKVDVNLTNDVDIKEYKQGQINAISRINNRLLDLVTNSK